MTVTREVVEHFDARPAARDRLMGRNDLAQRVRPPAIAQVAADDFVVSVVPQQKLIQIGPLDV